MSYDLYFRTRKPGATVTREEFAGYFAKRQHYKLTGSQAWYSNEDTGVYFSFEYQGQDSNEADDETAVSRIPVSFNLNYYRPHPFGLEAEPELSSFVGHFDLTVSDPQYSGMGDGEYSAEGFLRGWNAGNEFGYRAIVSRDPTEPRFSLPASRIEAAWRWNFHRQERQSCIGESAFVPKVFFLDMKGQVRTGTTWGDGIPSLLPEVDFLFVPRDQFAPRRWFWSAAKDIVVFPWREVQPILERFKKVTGEAPCYELFYAQTPSDIERLIRQARPPNAMPQGLAFDQVLDQELVEAARRPTG